MAPHLKTSRFHPNLSFHHQPFENNLNAISSKQTSPKTGSIAGVGRDKQTNQRREAESQWNPEQFEESGNDINKVNARDRRPCFFAPHIFGTKRLGAKNVLTQFFWEQMRFWHIWDILYGKSALVSPCAVLFPPVLWCVVLFPLCCALLCYVANPPALVNRFTSPSPHCEHSSSPATQLRILSLFEAFFQVNVKRKMLNCSGSEARRARMTLSCV